MVFQYQYWSRARFTTLIQGVVLLVGFASMDAAQVFADTSVEMELPADLPSDVMFLNESKAISSFSSQLEEPNAISGISRQPSAQSESSSLRPSGAQYLKEAARFYSNGQYFKSARYAFAAFEVNPALKPDAYAWVTMGLAHAGLTNAASYFFIRALQSGSPSAIRSVLTQSQTLLISDGADLFRKYLLKHTHIEDYDEKNRGAYLYALGKDALVSGDVQRASGYLSSIQSDSPIYPFALQLKATTSALLGRGEEAVYGFQSCADHAEDIIVQEGSSEASVRRSEREADDLRSRCIAGEARTLYQMNKFQEADRVYDSIPKHSFVWPDILFEQAWNSFAKAEYNRTLGKLVSYKSPALSFVFNSGVEVLRAQSYLAMCLYSDANEAVNEFNQKYTNVGVQVKEFVERNSTNLRSFYDSGKQSLNSPIYTQDPFKRLMNRFVRSPYFQNLVESERQVMREEEVIRSFDSTQTGVSHNMNRGFPGFLKEVLRWRVRTIHSLGGAFVKNSLLDYHASLIDDYEKMAFIKLEMLRLAKDKLIYKKDIHVQRDRGSQEPSRRDDQYRWSFNGEFWTDELGDYVFGLESECKG